MQFRESIDALLPWRTRVAALTSLVIMGGFALVDAAWVEHDELFFRSLIRAAFTPVYLMVMAAAARVSGRASHALVLALAFALALELGAIGLHRPPEESVGYFPAMLFFAAFLPLPVSRAVAMNALFLLGFVCTQVLFGHASAGALVKHGANLVATGGIAVVAAVMMERLQRSEFEARRSLAAESARAAVLARLAEEERRLSAAVVSGQDAERRRLALELHDGASQTLAGALMHLDLEISGASDRPRLLTSRSLVAQTLADLRAVSHGLHPPSLAVHGLSGALRNLADSMSSELADVSLQIEPGLPELLPAPALGLFRIAQAAVANVARHARARKVVVRLRRAGGELVLEVEDDGVGFVASSTDLGVGLLGMRERAQSLGGKLSIESDPGRGTRVRATVPLVTAPSSGA